MEIIIATYLGSCLFYTHCLRVFQSRFAGESLAISRAALAREHSALLAAPARPVGALEAALTGEHSALLAALAREVFAEEAALAGHIRALARGAALAGERLARGAALAGVAAACGTAFAPYLREIAPETALARELHMQKRQA